LTIKFTQSTSAASGGMISAQPMTHVLRSLIDHQMLRNFMT
jgi:hypothetical protein